MIDIKKKVVVVTGAGKIGSKIIKFLDREGVFVVFVDINKEVGKIIEKECDNAFFIHGDFANTGIITDAISYCIKQFGKIDSLINTAFPKPYNWGKKNFCDEIMFSHCMNEHLWGYYITTRLITHAVMVGQKFGSIINFSSIYGLIAPDFSIYEGTEIKMPIVYAMIKGAINMMSKYFASLFGKYGIRYNVISPGGVFEGQNEVFVNRYNWKVPLGRMAKESDLFGLIELLISDAGSYITGQNIVVDGGILSKL